MLHIIPIQDKGRQAEFAKIFAVPYGERAFAYLAVDDDTDGKVNSLIGFMQFVIGEDHAEIISLKEYDGVDDAEAMQIMARAAFAFIHRIGVKDVRIPKDAAGEELMKMLRMEDRGDMWGLDVERYFAAKCSER